VGAELARLIGGKARVGLMLHHAEMDAADLTLLHKLLRAVGQHPHARWCGMEELLHGPCAVPAAGAARTLRRGLASTAA
jgi:hypothetical protein